MTVWVAAKAPDAKATTVAVEKNMLMILAWKRMIMNMQEVKSKE